jgi:hypothetical protein
MFDDKVNALQRDLAAKVSAVTPIPQEQIPALVDQLLTAPADKIAKALESVPLLQADVINARVASAEISRQRQKALDDWKTTQATLQETSAKEDLMKLTVETEKAIDEAVKMATKSGNFILAESSADPSWNTQRARVIASAKQTIAAATTRRSLIDMAVQGATVPTLCQMLAALNAENQALRQSLIGASVTPASTIRSPPLQQPLPPTAPKKKVTIEGMVLEKLTGLRGGR